MSSLRSTGSMKKGALMISFFNRKGKLYLQFTVDGKTYQRSTKREDTPHNRTIVRKEVFPLLWAKIQNGEFATKHNRTIHEFSYYAEKYMKSKYHLKTYKSTKGIIDKRLLPIFGKKKVDSISRAECKEFTEVLLQTLSSKRVKTILNVLVAIIEIAVDYEHINRNPAKNIKLPKHIPSRAMQPFSKEEVRILISEADGWLKNLVAFLFFTGMRQGEVIALTWDDIDMDHMVINVDKRIKKGVKDTPKTISSIRKVPIFDMLKPYLINQKILCETIGSNHVFFNPNTHKGFFDANKLTSYWYDLLEGCGFQKRVFYNTRHTFITNMLRSGKMSMLDISQMVGHKTIEEIVSTYAKYLPEEHLKVSRKIDPFTDNSTDT